VPVAALRCRTTCVGGGLPSVLNGVSMTCGTAPAIAIAGLGTAL
jgi:hypothetical protein